MHQSVDNGILFFANTLLFFLIKNGGFGQAGGAGGEKNFESK